MRKVYLIAAIWLFIQCLNHFDETWVYQLTAWFICAIAVAGGVTTKTAWRWPLFLIAVVFNPIKPIQLDGAEWVHGDNWNLADVMTAVALLLFSFSKKK